MLSRGIDRLMDAATHSLAQDDDSWLDVIQVGGCPFQHASRLQAGTV